MYVCTYVHVRLVVPNPPPSAFKKETGFESPLLQMINDRMRMMMMLMMLMLMWMPEYPLSSVRAMIDSGRTLSRVPFWLVHENEWHDRACMGSPLTMASFQVRINGIPHHSGGPAFSHPQVGIPWPNVTTVSEWSDWTTRSGDLKPGPWFWKGPLSIHCCSLLTSMIEKSTTKESALVLWLGRSGPC